ncbi:DUF1850 domain-containing protein [Nonomuraea sp. MG754425]|uniref:DUF1850 domain-containing protein n=1 Tax=Nonomuraea sp. MG754425 TaxID=2570319 RepID=UPI001F31B83A|nr:DUF1850 domain-containing protein [Nonomuraea sp. MG754425]
MALALVAALGSGGGAGRPAVNGLPVVAGAFAIGYVHSIYRAPSAEVFTVEGRRFTMRAVLSVNEGVLDYYAVEGERVRLPGDVWLLRLAEPASYEELSLLTTSIGRRTVVSGGRCLPLYPATGAREVRLTVGLTQDAHGGPCDHNQSFFLKTMYNPTDIATISTEDTQKPQTSPVPG